MTINWENAPEGATHYVPESNSYHACWYKDDFKQSCLVAPKPHNAGAWTASPYRPDISARAIPVSEQAQTLAQAQAEIDALKAQNAELLAALESAAPHMLGYAGQAVREALAKARGEML